MQQVLCFGDSNTWGYNPENGERFPWGIRWTSILQQKLANKDIRIIEEGLCGRTTVFEDPLRQGRKGVSLFPTLLETHKPENIVIMLGTNDCKTVFSASPDVIGKGIRRLLIQAKQYSADSRILLVSPIHLGEQVWKDEFDPEFSPESVEVSRKLTDVYKDSRRVWCRISGGVICGGQQRGRSGAHESGRPCGSGGSDRGKDLSDGLLKELYRK